MINYLTEKGENMLNNPNAEEKGINPEEMKTPEQRAREAAESGEENERAERLENLRRLAEPMLDQYYQEGKTPFGISREQAMQRVSERIFDQVEAAGLEVDYDFLGRASEVLQAINEASGQHYTLSKAAIEVLEYHLQMATSGESDIDISEVAFIAGELAKHFKKATGVSLAEWAVEYQKVHGEEARNTYANEELIRIFDRDINSHILSQSNLVRIFAEYARSEGISQLDPQTALALLRERGFVVPEEWKDEYVENEDGREILGAIENAERKLQSEEIIATLEASYEELSPEDRETSPIIVADILAIASFGGEVPENWSACDDPTKKMIKDVMSQLATKLSGKLGTQKGEPIVKFKK